MAGVDRWWFWWREMGVMEKDFFGGTTADGQTKIFLYLFTPVSWTTVSTNCM
jgi:hypothetical protein